MPNLPKKMIMIICIIFLVVTLACVIYYRSLSCLPFIIGAFLGTIVSIIKVITLSRAVDKALKMGKKSAANYVRLQHFLRMLLTAAVLVASAIVPAISLWGAAAGIFAFQISLYILNFSSKI